MPRWRHTRILHDFCVQSVVRRTPGISLSARKVQKKPPQFGRFGSGPVQRSDIDICSAVTSSDWSDLHTEVFRHFRLRPDRSHGSAQLRSGKSEPRWWDGPLELWQDERWTLICLATSIVVSPAVTCSLLFPTDEVFFPILLVPTARNMHAISHYLCDVFHHFFLMLLFPLFLLVLLLLQNLYTAGGHARMYIYITLHT
jgi:hypothetical protein